MKAEVFSEEPLPVPPLSTHKHPDVRSIPLNIWDEQMKEEQIIDFATLTLRGVPRGYVRRCPRPKRGVCLTTEEHIHVPFETEKGTRRATVSKNPPPELLGQLQDKAYAAVTAWATAKVLYSGWKPRSEDVTPASDSELHLALTYKGVPFCILLDPATSRLVEINRTGLRSTEEAEELRELSRRVLTSLTWAGSGAGSIERNRLAPTLAALQEVTKKWGELYKQLESHQVFVGGR